MIKLFRKIRQKLLEQYKITQYLAYAVGEILLIVFGILIALQINTWNEGRKARSRELSTMKAIVENLKYDIIRCQRNSRRNFERLIGLDSLRISVGNTIEGTDESVKVYFYALKYGQDYSHVTLNRSGYNQLINSETIQLIGNRQLAENLSDYYERKSSAVLEYLPANSLIKLKTLQRKFIQFRGLDEYIRSFDSMDDSTYEPDIDYTDILKMEHLKLLKPEGIKLDDFFNEIAQFQIDLKTYDFYVSWLKEAAENLIKDIEKEYQFDQD